MTRCDKSYDVEIFRNSQWELLKRWKTKATADKQAKLFRLSGQTVRVVFVAPDATSDPSFSRVRAVVA